MLTIYHQEHSHQVACTTAGFFFFFVVAGFVSLYGLFLNLAIKANSHSAPIL